MPSGHVTFIDLASVHGRVLFFTVVSISPDVLSLKVQFPSLDSQVRNPGSVSHAKGQGFHRSKGNNRRKNSSSNIYV